MSEIKGLTLTRKLYQGAVINGNIYVYVTMIDKGKVRLTFDAPLDVQIHRLEKIEGTQNENTVDSQVQKNK